MSHSIFAIADTCFLIDWARFRFRDYLFKLFTTVFVSESVLKEVKSEDTIEWIANGLSKGLLSLYTESFDEIEEARKIVELSRRIPGMIFVDFPEALCIVVGRRRGYIVLTENKGAIMFTNIIKDYSSVVVWRSFEILLTLHIKKLINVNCENALAMFKIYEGDTKHIFPRRDMEIAENVIRNELCRNRL
ncbi:hypothetical protein QPL79_05235 [Ignisphaera sp. 4213-co]|uniref:DNA-binding protein n=1 Tax=Ignisphaera cupida TaxID=3050454 RepID=A0ABD4Z6F5_9CREN|nr:hypothetical protein [Ignisphaera sp. 4213-co]MDK6028760.1 hypothetical protein [Ignisphaera sp. 4213-co]